jgi:hypothetical protein
MHDKKSGYDGRQNTPPKEEKKEGVGKPNSEWAGLCQSIEPANCPLKDCIEDGKLKFANGQFIPVMNGICDKHSVSADGWMPVCKGYVGEVKDENLRDSGCSGVAVKHELVTPDQLTGKEHYCVLVDMVDIPL